MKSIFYLLSLALIVCFPATAFCQTASGPDVEIFPDVLKTAEWANFPYKDQVKLAKGNDFNAIKKLLNFSGTVDGTEAIQHSVTCIEILALGNDDMFATAISAAKPKLKSVLLERFQLAQASTKKEALRKPMQEWASNTWEALNGRPITSCMQLSGGTKSAKEAVDPARAKEKQAMENSNTSAEKTTQTNASEDPGNTTAKPNATTSSSGKTLKPTKTVKNVTFKKN